MRKEHLGRKSFSPWLSPEDAHPAQLADEAKISHINKSVETESRLVAARGWGMWAVIA